MEMNGAPPELVDIRIYIFCHMAGVTQSDNIHGNPIVFGVVIMVFPMLNTAKESTRKAFHDYDSKSTAMNRENSRLLLHQGLNLPKITR